MNILEVINVSRDVTWLPWAVQYFFLIGLSTACLFMSLAGVVSSQGHGARFSRLALVGALVCGLTAPVALLADLHQPGRFWRFYAHPNFGSWMAWGAFFSPLYLAGLAVYAWALWKPDLAAAGRSSGTLAPLYRLASRGHQPAPRLVVISAIFTSLMAMLVLGYTGMEMMVVKARPLWNTPVLPLQLAATAFIGASGLVLLLDRGLGAHDGTTENVARRWLFWSLVATCALGTLWLLLGVSHVSATHAAALASVVGHKAWQMTAKWAAVSVLVPLALLVWRPAAFGWLLGLIALHAAWMFRWTVFIGGQTVPKTGAGLYAYQLPLGHDGLLGIAGTAGLWIAILIILTSLLPRSILAAAAPRTPAE